MTINWLDFPPKYPSWGFHLFFLPAVYILFIFLKKLITLVNIYEPLSQEYEMQ